MKKIIIITIVIVVITIIFWEVLPTSSQVTPPVSARASSTPLPTPSPTPITLNKNSNLLEEAGKLTVPGYQQDYKALDQSLSQF